MGNFKRTRYKVRIIDEELPVETALVKSLTIVDGWAAEFTIGVQTFTVVNRENKSEALWYQQQVSNSLELLIAHATRKARL